VAFSSETTVESRLARAAAFARHRLAAGLVLAGLLALLCSPARTVHGPGKPPQCATASSEAVPCARVGHCLPCGEQWQTAVNHPCLATDGTSAGRNVPVVLCQALGPAAPCAICGVDCSQCDHSGCQGWEAARAIAWQAYAQGEYVGHERLAHVPEYRLRVDDQLDMIYRLTREETSTPYQLNVGDEIRVESFTDEALNRDLIVQPDGTITLRLLGQVRATGRTVVQLRDALEERYKKYYNVPAITVTPLKVNTKLEDLRASVDRRAGLGGQSQLVRVTPEGTVSLPAIGSVPAQGLSLPELQEEVNERYRQQIEGIEVIPVLVQRAPRYVYVLGEVGNPGRFELTGPTTVLQALSMAGSWNVGANIRQIVVFRRGDDWRLMATMLNLDAALHGKQPCPPGEIWLSDSDVIIVPKSRILVADDFINLVFTRGIYGVFPLSSVINFSKLSSL
jgi:polysaccharide export outer membrane protein